MSNVRTTRILAAGKSMKRETPMERLQRKMASKKAGRRAPSVAAVARPTVVVGTPPRLAAPLTLGSPPHLTRPTALGSPPHVAPSVVVGSPPPLMPMVVVKKSGASPASSVEVVGEVPGGASVVQGGGVTASRSNTTEAHGAPGISTALGGPEDVSTIAAPAADATSAASIPVACTTATAASGDIASTAATSAAAGSAATGVDVAASIPAAHAAAAAATGVDVAAAIPAANAADEEGEGGEEEERRKYSAAASSGERKPPSVNEAIPPPSLACENLELKSDRSLTPRRTTHLATAEATLCTVRQGPMKNVLASLLGSTVIAKNGERVLATSFPCVSALRQLKYCGPVGASEALALARVLVARCALSSHDEPRRGGGVLMSCVAVVV